MSMKQPTAGTEVEVNVTNDFDRCSDPKWETYVVCDLLSSQFTAYKKGKSPLDVKYFFYAHRNDTWRMK